MLIEKRKLFSSILLNLVLIEERGVPFSKNFRKRGVPFSKFFQKRGVPFKKIAKRSMQNNCFSDIIRVNN